VAPVVLEVVDAPTGVLLGILKLVAPAAGPPAARLRARIGVDAKLEAFAVDVIGQRLHTRRKALGIGLNEALCIALAVPAVVDVDVGVAGVLHAASHHGISHFLNQFLIDVAGKLVPAVPAHGGPQGFDPRRQPRERDLAGGAVVDDVYGVHSLGGIAEGRAADVGSVGCEGQVGYVLGCSGELLQVPEALGGVQRGRVMENATA
nr:hypothetical protein [Tanacetum cinerariifolium]